MKLIGRFPHYAAFALVLALMWSSLLYRAPRDAALLISFDAAVLAFLGVLIWQTRSATPASLQATAMEPGHGLLRLIAMLVLGVVLTGVGAELEDGGRNAASIALVALSLSMAWLFANSLFALHYLHLYYRSDANGAPGKGLAFPDDGQPPDLWDFCYFAFTVGMTFQVSDVVITARPMRRLVLLHGLLAFIYNIAVIALTVSLMASALS